MWKKGLCLLTAVILLFSLAGCSDWVGGAVFMWLIATGDDRVSKEEILSFVRENEEALLEAVESGDYSDFENRGFIQGIDEGGTAVDFYCGGVGIAPSSTYVGFFYTEENDPAAIWCAPGSADMLTPSGNGLSWRETNGDNRYYTEHICGNFYYYESSY